MIEDGETREVKTRGAGDERSNYVSCDVQAQPRKRQEHGV